MGSDYASMVRRAAPALVLAFPRSRLGRGRARAEQEGQRPGWCGVSLARAVCRTDLPPEISMCIRTNGRTARGRLTDILWRLYSLQVMSWGIEFTDEFGLWWDDLSKDEQDSIDRSVGLLETLGPSLPFPHSSSINGSRHGNMRELRVQHGGDPYRVLYAFDPPRTAILLIGGNKSGDDRFYERMVPIADRIYDQHLEELKRGGDPAT